MGDSQGMLTAIPSAALLRGEMHAISWRAHDGKVACLHARPDDAGFLSGGSDGAVRWWSYVALAKEAAAKRTSDGSMAVGTSGGGSAVQASEAAGVTSGGVVRRVVGGGSSRLRGSACVDLGVWPLCEVGSRVMLPQQHPPFAPSISLASLTFCMSPPCRAVRFSLVVLPHLATYPFSNHLEVPSFCLTVPCDIRLLPDMRTHLRALRMTPPGAPRCPPWRYDRRTVPRRRGGCIREPRGSSALLLAVSLSTLLSLLIASLPTLPQGC